MQFLLSQSPYRDLLVPWRIFHAHDMDAVDLLPTIVQFFIVKPVLLCALSSKHLVSFQLNISHFCSHGCILTGKSRLGNLSELICSRRNTVNIIYVMH